MKDHYVVEVHHLDDGPFESLEDMHSFAVEKLHEYMLSNVVLASRELAFDPSIYFNLEAGYESSTFTFDMELV